MSNYTEILCPSADEASNILDDGTPSRRFRWVVQIEVDEVWVADGLNLTADIVKDYISALLATRDDELNVKVLASPDPVEIKQAQGYN